MIHFQVCEDAKSLISYRNAQRTPIDSPQGQIYVRSQFVQLRFPALRVQGGLIWNRPSAVVVRPLNGQETTLPIIDVTRIALLALTGLMLATVFVSIFMRRKTSRS